jgi:large subunit ribosomal protein L49
VKQSGPPLQLTNLPYFVRRTASNQLPVYVVTKAGGTKQLTKIQKTEGDLDALRNDLALALGVVDGSKPNPDVTLNRLTGHIIVKVCISTMVGLYSNKSSYIIQGWRKPEIVNFLQERRF